MEQKKVDIEYIAKVAGVSRSTVSRVLTNKSNVKKDTKLRVQEVMRELNYHPSIMARGLATGKLNIVALIVSDILQSLLFRACLVYQRSSSAKGVSYDSV